MLNKLPMISDSSVLGYQITIPYTSIASPTLTFIYTIVGIPINYVVCGTCVRLLTTFGGSSLTSLTCSLGAFVPNTILTDLTFYGMALELTQTPTSQSFQTSGPPTNDLNNLVNFAPSTALYYNGAHDVSAYFTAQGTNLNNLTSGAVEISVHIRPL